MRQQPRTSSSTALRLLLALVLVAVGLPVLAPAPAVAVGTPDLDVTVELPERVAYGRDLDATITVANPTAVRGHHLAVRLVLPPGVAVVPGSIDVAEPIVVDDAPALGQTTVLLRDLGEVGPFAERTIAVALSHDVAPAGTALRPGSVVAMEASAHANDDPTVRPTFDDIGLPTGGFTGTDTATDSSLVAPFTVTLDEPSPGGLVLRGVHDNQVVQTVRVRNTTEAPTTDVDVEVWLHAGWEFLACGDVDHTTAAATAPGGVEEFATAGSLDGRVPAPAGCAVPDLVETVFVDPDGGGPLGLNVYTRVLWDDVASLAAGQELALPFVAAVPLRGNALAWSGGPPAKTDAGGATPRQAANLDNNSGARTAHGAAITTRVRVRGTYAGGYDAGANPASAATTMTRTAVDHRVTTVLDDDALAAGSVRTATTTIEVGEYRWLRATPSVLVDVPDGLCPTGLGIVDGRCTAGPAPRFAANGGGDVALSWSSEVERPDGGFDLVAELPQPLGPGATATLVHELEVRPQRQEDGADEGPLLATDVVALATRLTSPSSLRCVDAGVVPPCVGSPSAGAGEPGNLPEGPGDGAVVAGPDDVQELAAPTPTLSIEVAENPLPVVGDHDCATATWTTATVDHRPGDRLCLRVVLEQPPGATAGAARVLLVVPEGLSLEADSPTTGPGHTAAAPTVDATATQVAWDLGDLGPGERFEALVALRVAAEPAVGSAALERVHAATSALTGVDGSTTVGRDVVMDRQVEPRLVVDLSVEGEDATTARQGETVAHLLTLTNDGLAGTDDVQARVVLPPSLACEDVSALDPGLACVAGTIHADGTNGSTTFGPLAAGASSSRGFDVTVPDGTGASPAPAAGEQLVVDGGVVQHLLTANRTGVTVPFVPASNIDPGQDAIANTDAADDDAQTTLPLATIGLAAPTGLDEAGNAADGAAANGEAVDLVATFTLPAGTTVRDAVVAVPVPTELVVAPGAATLAGPGLAGAEAADCAADLSNGWRLCDAGGTVTVDLGPDVTNGTLADQVWTLTVPAVVAATAARGDVVAATATLDWAPAFAQASAATTTVVVAEPQLAKTSDAVGEVGPGQEVGFTLVVGNDAAGTGSDVGTWHDVVVDDVLPDQLLPLDAPGGTPVSDGGTVTGAGPDGTWDLATRTISWSLGSIDPATATTLGYAVEVTSSPVASAAYVNAAEAAGDSHPGVAAAQVALVASAEATLDVPAPEVALALDDEGATIGDTRTLTATVTVPPDVRMPATTVDVDLPDGLSLVGFGVGPPGATTSSVGPRPDGTWTATWDLGDLAIEPTARELELPVQVRVDDLAAAGPVRRGQLLRSRATLAWEDAGGDPVTIDPAVTEVLVTEPSLTVDLDLVGQAGDSDVLRVDVDARVTLTLSLTNANLPDVSAAHDVRMVVDVPEGLDVDPATITGLGVHDPVARTITWDRAGPIVPGASESVAFAADVADSTTFGAAAGLSGLRTSGTLLRWFGRDQVDPAAPAATDRAYTGPSDETTTQVDVPVLRVAASGDSAETRTGQPFEWVVEVNNDATVATADGVLLDLLLPPSWTFDVDSMEVQHPGSGGAFVPFAPLVSGRDVQVDLDLLADLGPGDRFVVRFDATPGPGTAVDPGVGNANVLDVTLSALDGDGNPGNAEAPYGRSTTASTIVREVADIALVVEIDKETVDLAAPDMVFSVTVDNLGPNDATNLVVDAEVPLTQLDVTAQTPSQGTWDPVTGAWTIGTLPAGETVTLVVDLAAQRPEPADPDPIEVTGAVVSLDQFDEGLGPSSGTDTVHVERADLRLDVASTPGPWFLGDTITLDLTLTNDGPDPAADIDVTTAISPGMTVLGDGGSGTWNGARWDVPTLAANASVSHEITVRLDAVGVQTFEAELTAADEADPDSIPGNGVVGEDDQGSRVLTVSGGELGDLVWFDADADGAQDPGEPAMEGVVVELRDASDTLVTLATTDAAGAWVFDELTGGTWTVRVRTSTLPAGTEVVGGADRTVTIANGEVRDDLDLGVTGLAWVGDDTWYDVDGNGLRDPGEPPVPDLQVVVTWFGPDDLPGTADDVVYPAATSAASGAWATSRLPRGTFQAEVTGGIPAGMVASYDLDGVVTPGSVVFDVTDDVGRTDLDWGWTGDGAMGDLVWFDVDGDGDAGADEPGIPGVEVALRWFGADGVDGTTDDVVFPSVVTDADGGWARSGLPSGEYEVRIAGGVPAGLVVTEDPDPADDGVTQLTLVAASVLTDVDFGYAGTGQLGDTLYLDLDGSATLNGSEPGIVGVPLTATWYGFDDTLGTADDVSWTIETITDGEWRVQRAAPGTYRVAVAPTDLPAGTAFAGDPDGGTDGEFVAVLEPDERRDDADLGVVGSGRLGDLVWLDDERDGTYDGDEVGLPDVDVALDWTGPDGSFGTDDDLALPPTRTGADGGWSYPNLPAGGFSVQLVPASLPGGTSPAVDPDGGSDGRADLFLAPGGVVETLDFGLRGVDVVGDTVFLDLDADGEQELGEPGLPGVDLTLTWAGPDRSFGTGDDTVRTTTTAADGSYAFEGLPDGPVRVVLDRSDLPAGTAATTDGDETPDGIAEIDLVGGTGNVDFGVAGTGEVGDAVWLDLDGDGLDSPGEPGLAGVTLTITWTGPDGSAGTADDVTWPPFTTDAAGRWTGEHLVRGTYVVEATGGAAEGLRPTYDLDDGDNDPDGHVSGVFVAAGGARDDLDFAFVGPWAMGDLAWFDLDGDGEPGETEPGIGDVDVVVTWAGADSTLGTLDDVVITTTTARDGSWRLPGMPSGVVQVTSDPDSVPPSIEAAPPTMLTTTLLADDLDLDLPFRGTSGVGDLVWVDVDGDGQRQMIEPGVADALVRVTWAGTDGAHGTADDVVASARTDAAGRWTVRGLPGGAMRVVLVDSSLPAGLFPVGGAVEVVLAEGEIRDDVDLAVRGVASLAGTTFVDLDKDGATDADEPRLDGVTVTLLGAGQDDAFGTGDDVMPDQVVTDVDGRWTVEDLSPGRWRLAVRDAPAGLVLHVDPDSPPGSADGVAELVLGAGEVLDGQDVGWAASAVLAGTVRLDRSGDGVAGLVVVATWSGRDGTIGTADDATLRTTSDAAGAWELDGLPAGPWQLAFEPPAGFAVVTAPDPDLALLDGQRIGDLDVLLRGAASAGGVVWLDVDGDGARGPADAGLAGMAVDVGWAGPDDTAGTADDVAYPQVVTDADGAWRADGLPGGMLVVTLDTRPAGTVPTTDGDGDADGRVVAPAGDALDLGLVGTGRVGDRAWWDADGDGLDDGVDGAPAATDRATLSSAADRRPEGGVPGVVLRGTWVGLDGVPGTGDDVALPAVTTGDGGAWSLGFLPAGRLQLAVDAPAGWAVTGGDRWIVTLEADADRDDVDVALTGMAAVTGVVVDDRDGDGARDTAEPTLPGVGLAVDHVGPDGEPGTADDVVAARISDLDGRFEVRDLPPGTARVQPAGLSAGTVPTVPVPLAVPAAVDPTDVLVPLRRAADLAVVKTALDPMGVGAVARWSLAVGNSGPAPATGVELVDPLPAGLVPTGAAVDGWTCGPQPTGAEAVELLAAGLDEGDESWTCRYDGVVGVGEVVSMELPVQVEQAAFPSVTNRALVRSDGPDPDPSDNVDVATVDVRPLANLLLEKRVTDDVYAGGEAIYELALTNRGPNVDPGPITITDDLPDGLELTAWGGIDWRCDEGDGGPGAEVVCTFGDVLAPGERTVVLLTVSVLAEPGALLTNVATAEGGAVNPVPDDAVAVLADVPVLGRAGGGTPLLPRTGATVGWWVLASLVLLAGGGGLVAVSRRAATRGRP